MTSCSPGRRCAQLRADVDVLHLLVSPARGRRRGPAARASTRCSWPTCRGSASDAPAADPAAARRPARPAAARSATTRSSCSPPTTRARCRWRCSRVGRRPAGRRDERRLPGSLLDVRHRRMPTGDDPGSAGGHEVEAMCALVDGGRPPAAPVTTASAVSPPRRRRPGSGGAVRRRAPDGLGPGPRASAPSARPRARRALAADGLAGRRHRRPGRRRGRAGP